MIADIDRKCEMANGLLAELNLTCGVQRSKKKHDIGVEVDVNLGWDVDGYPRAGEFGSEFKLVVS